MFERRLKPGAKLTFRIPANPMSDVMAEAIGQVVSQIGEIREAYLPECHIDGEQGTRQVLVIGVERSSQIEKVMPELMSNLRLILPTGQFLDILPFASSSMPADARLREYQIFKSEKKVPWWKFWQR